jgi:organic hydroperoxide reductase OsmC/OhrA
MIQAMADEKIEIIRSTSSGVVGRANNSTRDAALVLDSSSRPHPDAFTNSEAFLAGVSSCGVTLIEMHAREIGVPLRSMTATIEGARVPPEPRFSRVTMRFELVGVSQAQADELVETYRRR